MVTKVNQYKCPLGAFSLETANEAPEIMSRAKRTVKHKRNAPSIYWPDNLVTDQE